MRKTFSTSSDSQSGAMLILFAFLLVALFGFLALTIDTTLFTSSQSHLTTSTDAAVLGALQEYGNRLGTSSNPTPAQVNQALDDAILRANDILGRNFAHNPGKFLQKDQLNTQDNIGTDCSPTATGNGCLRPIIWYSPVPVGPDCPATLPTDSDDPLWRPCACDQSCECGQGCANDPFVKQRAGNGLKLIYRTDQNSPIKALFGSVVSILTGGTGMQAGLQASSTAILTPRNAIFLLDLSESMIALARPVGLIPATYYDRNPASMMPSPPADTCFRRRYAYPIPVANSCAISNIEPPSPPAAATVFFSKPRMNYINCDPAATAASNHRCLSGASSITVNFEGGATRQDNFRVNVAVDPEPLTSALDAVNLAMNSFKSKKVPNDRLGIIGFDDTRINNRILAANISDAATIQPAVLADPLFNEFELATKASGPGAIPIDDSRRYTKYLFPRYYGSPPTNAPGDVYSDLPENLKLARDMIKHSPNYRQSQNFVVMFSDGMTNCLDPMSPSPRCQTSSTYLNQSMGLLQNVMALYSQDKIAVHFFLVGAKSMPHTLAWKSPQGGCVAAEDMQNMNLPAVDAQGSWDPDGTPLVNQIYPWVKATGGLWAPILDSFGVNPTGSCPNYAAGAVDAACSANISDNATLLSALTASGATFSGGAVLGGAAVWPAGPWDPRGRLLCDPKNRTISEQVNDYMKLILNKPPYSLVRPN